MNSSFERPHVQVEGSPACQRHHIVAKSTEKNVTNWVAQALAQLDAQWFKTQVSEESR